VGLVVGDTAAEIEQAVGDGAAWGLSVSYIPQEAPLGLAHTVLISREFLGDDDFVMYLGDNVLKGGIAKLVAAFEERPCDAQILLTRVHDPERFGVAELDGDRIVRLIEKPKDPPSDLALVGVYLFTPLIHEAVRAISPSGRGELEITDAIQYLIDQGREVRPHLVEGWWKDTGKLEDLLEANRLIMEDMPEERAGTADGSSRLVGNVVLQEGSQVANSTVRGPAVIGRNSRVVDSFIGPYTSIGDGCTIEDSEIVHP
jgi:glucose-1-phosphate thymidylyltransferase